MHGLCRLSLFGGPLKRASCGDTLKDSWRDTARHRACRPVGTYGHARTTSIHRETLVKFDRRRGRLAALTLALALVACSRPSAQEDLASARQHLAAGDAKAALIEVRNALQTDPSLAEARFLLGRLLLSQGDPSGAEIELEKAQKAGWPANETEPLRARALLMTGQSEALLQRYADRRLTDPQAQVALQLAVAQAYLVKPEPSKAMKAVEAAMTADPASLPAQLMHVRLLAATGDMQRSDQQLQLLLAQHPANAAVLHTRGDWLRVAGRSDEALQAFRAALAADPKAEDARLALVQLLIAQHDLKAADEALQPLHNVAPQRLQVRLLMALLAFERGEYGPAREAVLQLLKQAPDHPAVLQLAGQVEAQRGALVQAESYLSKSVQQSPNQAPARLALAQVQLRAGDGAKTLQTLQPLLGSEPPRLEALSLAGQASLLSGDFKAAEEYFGRAVSLNPEDPQKRIALALARIGQGRGAQGIAELESIAASDDGGSADLALIGGYLRLQQLDKALEAVERLEAKAGMKAAAAQMRGQIELRRGHPEAARAAFEAALQANPALLPAATALATMDGAQGRWPDAVKRFERVVAADSRQVQAHLALIGARERAGTPPEESLRALQALVQQLPQAGAARVALVEALIRQRQAQAAVTAAQQARLALPDSPEMAELVGRAQLAAGEPQMALAAFREMQQMAPRSAVPWTRQAEAHVAARQFDQVVPALKKALTTRPGDADVQRLMVIALIGRGQQDEALKFTAQIQRGTPQRALGYVLEGDVRASVKDWTRASAAYRAALQREESTPLAIKLHRALMAAQSRSEAARFAQQWVAAHRSDSGFALHLADSALETKEYDTARREYSRVVQVDPQNAAAWNNLGWLLMQVKDARALEHVQKARSLAPQEPAFMDTEAEIRAQVGQLKEALTLQQAVVDKAPDQPIYRLHLARLLTTAGKKDDARQELNRLAALGERFPQQAEVKDLMKAL